MLPQLLASGLSVGSIYALIALAMVLLYKTSEVPNFAQGDMGMVCAFAAYTFLATYNLPFGWAFTNGLGVTICP